MRNEPLGLPVTANKAAIAAVLRTKGLKEYGTSEGQIRDSDFSKDLGNIIARAVPHTIKDALGISKVVSVKLDTLQVMVDDNNEVVAWTYQES